MSYGLTPTTNAAVGTAPQPPRNPVPESNTNTATKKGESTSRPKTPPFIPHAYKYPKAPTDITGRKTTPLSQTPSTPMPLPQRKEAPFNVQASIDSAFRKLKERKFKEAETAFRETLKHKKELKEYKYNSAVIGLARSLKEQTREKQEEACEMLVSLKQKGERTEFGASKIYDLDMVLSRCQEALGQNFKAEALLLSLRYKRPDAGEDSQCNPFGCRVEDLTLARLWQKMGKHNLAERLLQNIKNEQTESLRLTKRQLLEMQRLKVKTEITKEQREEELTRLNDDKNTLQKKLDETDLALAKLWEAMGKYKPAEKLLLSISGKYPSTSTCPCTPCGHHNIDLALVRLWGKMKKYDPAEKLLKHCFQLYRTAECKRTLLGIFVGREGFMEMVAELPESADTLQSISIHYFTLACREIIESSPESGQENLKKALKSVESALEKYPKTAKALSQKAHCLKMMGKDKHQWRSLFDEAHRLDPNRAGQNKNQDWRELENKAYDIVIKKR